MADAKSLAKRQEANHAILAALDIEAEYRSIGLRIPSNARARATGWMPCHAMGREDNSPSAEINVGDGPARGRYRDFGGGGETLSYFDFAAKHGSGYGSDWRQVRNAKARDLKIKLPLGAEEVPADKFEFFDLTPGTLLLWAKTKPPVSAAAVRAAGGRGARWPKGLRAELTQHLIAFPMFGGHLLDLEPIGWHCANSNGQPIKIYQGKGNEPKPVKTMQIGEPGLMNVAGLRGLPEASVVWVVEGLSDMLALQTALMAMPEDLGHVVLTAGGASYHPKPEWMQHFAGKDVRVCFDLDQPDPLTGKRAGETGAKVWVGALITVAETVRNVVLPFVEGSGKKDIRDFLQDHGYNDLWELSETFAPVPLAPVNGDGQAHAAPGEALTPRQAMLVQLGIVVAGQVEGTDWIEVFSQATHKKTLIKDIDRLSLPKANLFFGGRICDQFINEGLEPVPGKYKLKDLQIGIAAEAAEHYLSDEPDRGCGIWHTPDKKRLVLVGPRAAEVWDGDTLTPIETPAIDGQRLDFGGRPWYDRDELLRNLESAKDTSWCQEVIHGANKLFGRWENWHRYATTPQLVTGLVAATWVQTIWEVRPQVCIVGMTNSGKSFLLNECLKKMFGPLGLWIDKPSEAAIRQRLGHTARLLLIDEFENDEKNRQRVLEMMRVSSRGGQIGRGTSNTQKGVLFPLRHMSWTAAKNFKLTDAADRNRFIILNLDNLPDGHVAKLQMPADEVLETLGQRLLAIAIRYSRCAAKMAGEMKRHKAWGVDNRTAEIHAVPISLLACAQGWSMESAVGFLEEVLGEHQKDKPAEDDREQLIRDILESVVHLGRGGKTTVSALLWDQVIEDGSGHAIDRDEALATGGIKTINELPRKLFLSPRTLTRGILKDSDFSKSDLTQILTQIPDSEQCRQQVGIHKSRGVMIPFTYFVAERERKVEF